MVYAVTTEDAVPAADRYSEAVPAAAEVGTYYVWYRVIGDANHPDTEPACILAYIVPPFASPDFILPKNMKAIGENMFENNTALTTVDAANCQTVGAEAFKDCTGLEQVRLPKDCQISDSAFDGCGTVFIFAPAGGSTELFCSGHDNCLFIAE
jgi:hypothetical protein